MDTATILITLDQANSQDFRNVILRHEGQLQTLRRLLSEHETHKIELYDEYCHPETTTQRKEQLMRRNARTDRGIASIQAQIDWHEGEIRMEQENQRRRHEEIVNAVNHFLHPRHGQ